MYCIRLGCKTTNIRSKLLNLILKITFKSYNLGQLYCQKSSEKFEDYRNFENIVFQRVDNLGCSM